MKVSIITPSYNQGRFIERTLKSVAMQSLPGAELEHMVCDGGSSDMTIDVLEQYSDRIRWISEKDHGQADAVNKGIRDTDGEIIGWLNSDDIYYPNALSRVVTYFEAHPEIDIVYGQADHIDEDDIPFELYPTEPWDYLRLKQICFICQPALFFRRRVVERHGFLNEKLHYCMDYEYWLRLGDAGVTFGYLEQKLAGSRLYNDNKTLRKRIQVHAEINDMLKVKYGKVPDRWLINYAHAVVEGKTSRSNSPRWFMFRLIVSTAAAAWRWNGKISDGMWLSFSRWSKMTLLKGCKK